MAILKFDITFTGKDNVPPPRSIVIDPDELPMGLDEDMQAAVATGDVSIVNKTIADMLGLSHEEFRHLKKGDFKRIMAAMKEAQNEPIPNA